MARIPFPTAFLATFVGVKPEYSYVRKSDGERATSAARLQFLVHAADGSANVLEIAAPQAVEAVGSASIDGLKQTAEYRITGEVMLGGWGDSSYFKIAAIEQASQKQAA